MRSRVVVYLENKVTTFKHTLFECLLGCIYNLSAVSSDALLFLIMSIEPTGILILKPLRRDIIEGVKYAVESIPHTYNRMKKPPWMRAARIARGKVNEQMVLRALQAIGIDAVTMKKSYREFDFTDYVLNPKGSAIRADLKTFHIIEGFVKPPRQLFDPSHLLSCGDRTGPWQDFYPMLVPADYKKPKDLFIFGVSIEPDIFQGTTPLDFSWRAFPQTEEDEELLINPEVIKEREKTGKLLSVTVTWPQSVRSPDGRFSVAFEKGKKVCGHKIDLASHPSDQRRDLSSFICIGLNDPAYEALRSSGRGVALEVFDQFTGRIVLSRTFNARHFREIFPRNGYQLNLVGWITRKEFMSRATMIPPSTPCYFYPPKNDPKDKMEPGTKTDNRYVLPQTLNPINTLFGAIR